MLTAKYLRLSQEELEEIESLAAIGYNDKRMAMYLGVDEALFRKEFLDQNSLVRYHYNIGITRSDAIIGIKLEENAKGGNITAIQQLDKIKQSQKIENLKQQIYFANELD